MPVYEAQLSSHYGHINKGAEAEVFLKQVFEKAQFGDRTRGFCHDNKAVLVASQLVGRAELHARYPGIFNNLKPASTVDLD